MEVIFEYAAQGLRDFWAVLAEMAPYLLFGFLVAGILSVLVTQQMVERHLGGRGMWPLVKASIFGVPLPMCSCGVIPVSMSLYRHGAGKGSTISFLLSTPQTGVDSILVTLSLLGPLFAVFRPLAAFVTGIFGGGAVSLFGGGEAEDAGTVAECNDPCCQSGQNSIVRGLRYGFVSLPADIGRDLLIGLLLAAGISAVIPEGFFAEYLGTGVFSMVVMMALGVPVYVCATASIPIAAAMMLRGLTPGAAIVFLMTGPATNAASVVMIWRAMGTRTLVTYLVSVAICSLASGLLFDYIWVAGDFSVAGPEHFELPEIVKNILAVGLLCVLGYAIFGRRIVDRFYASGQNEKTEKD